MMKTGFESPNSEVLFLVSAGVVLQRRLYKAIPYRHPSQPALSVSCIVLPTIVFTGCEPGSRADGVEMCGARLVQCL